MQDEIDEEEIAKLLALNVSTRLAACRTLNERKRFLIRYAKQQFFERVRR